MGWMGQTLNTQPRTMDSFMDSSGFLRYAITCVIRFRDDNLQSRVSKRIKCKLFKSKHSLYSGTSPKITTRYPISEITDQIDLVEVIEST